MSRQSPTRTDARGPIAGLLDAVETLPGSALSWGVSLGVLITIRNCLELLLEQPHRFPTGQELLAYGTFYVSLYLCLAAVVSAFTGGEVVRVCRATAVGFALILLPPLLDWLLTRGEGRRLTYILSDAHGLWLNFWTFCGHAPGISPGIRVEVAAAILLIAAYVAAKTDCAWRVVAAALTAYTVIFAHGALPSLIHLASVRGMSPQPDPFEFFIESRFLLLAIAVGIALYARHDWQQLHTLLRHGRWERNLHYVGLCGAGIAAGYLTSPEHVQFVRTQAGASLGTPYVPVDEVFVRVALLLLAVAFAFHAGKVWNDLSDRRIDDRNAVLNPLTTRALSGTTYRTAGAFSAVVALLCSAMVGWGQFLLIVVALGLAWVFSMEPFRLKRLPVASFVLAAISLTCFGTGLGILPDHVLAVAVPFRYLVVGFMSYALAINFKDLKDLEGDRAYGVLSLPVLLGETRARRVIALFTFVAFVLPVVVVPRAWCATVGACAGIAGAWVVRSPGLSPLQRDRLYLAVYFAYVFVALVCWLVFDHLPNRG